MEVFLKVELGVNAQKIISQLRVNHQDIEKHVENGINLAIKELFEENNFERMVADSVKSDLVQTIKNAANEWALKSKVQEAVRKSVDGKIEEIAAKWAEELTKNIK